MPVFINEVVVRTSLTERPQTPASGQPGQSQGDGQLLQQDALNAEIARIVREYIEIELERLGER